MSQHDMIIDNAPGATVRADINNALQALASNSLGGTAPTTTYAGQTWLDSSGTNPVYKIRNSANSAWLSAFSIDSSSNIGIGTGSPAAGKNITLGNDSSGTATVGLSFATSGQERGSITVAGSTGEQKFTAGYAGYGGFQTFHTNGSERMRIDSSGNLGLGVTPSAWISSGHLQFYYGAVGSSSSGYPQLINNAYESAINTYKYTNSGLGASRYDQQFGIHTWYTAPSGTAGNTISWTQGMVLDASGRLGIGTTAPNDKLEINGGNVIFSGSNLLYSYSGGTYNQVRSGIYYDGSTPSLQFYTSQAERMRINSSGYVSIGTTAYSGLFTLYTNTSNFWPEYIYGNDRGTVYLMSSSAGYAQYYQTTVAGSAVLAGYVYLNGATTLYYSASDYRMKENIEPLQKGLDIVSKIRPVSFTWKCDGKVGEGFIAHELQEVAPLAVGGVKDGIDSEGKPEYQAVDNAKLVPYLVKAIQEQQEQIDALKAEIAEIKGN